MDTYHKIQTLFKRQQDGPKKGKMLRGQWTTPELEYLAGNEWEFTEKVDGTNVRVGWTSSGQAPTIAGRTDKAVFPKPLQKVLDDLFTHERFRKAFEMDPGAKPYDVLLFGEGYGTNIQAGHKYGLDPRFVLFDVKVGDTWLLRKDVNDVATKLGIDSVPVIGHGTLQDAIDIVSSGITFGTRGDIIRWGSGNLRSRWGNFEAEGIVARPRVPMFDRQGGRIITKIKAVDFK